MDSETEKLIRERERAEAECERLRRSLQNVMVHTGHTKTSPDRLHMELLGRIAQIVSNALATPPPEDLEPSDTHEWTERDSSGALMCAHCGVDLDDDESARPCNAPHTPEQTKCPNCGGRGRTDASGTGCICQPEQTGDALAEKYHNADAEQPGAVVRADTFELELRALLDGE